MKDIKTILALFAISLVSLVGHSQQCVNSKNCNGTDLEDYDYRSQSLYGTLSPGDTCKLKVVLYSNNDVKIFTCSDPTLGKLDFRILRTVREYKRAVDHIDRSTTDEPVYKTDKEGNPVPMLDDWGEPQKDDNGQIKFTILDYKKKEIRDTVWKTERKVHDDPIFDSRSGKTVYEETVKKTESVTIEVVVPGASDPKQKKMVGCASIMVGRMFHTSGMKTKLGKK